MWYNNIAPFNSPNRKRVLVSHILTVLQAWYEDCIKTNTRLFGSDENAQEVSEFLEGLEERPGDLGAEDLARCADLRRRILRAFR